MAAGLREMQGKSMGFRDSDRQIQICFRHYTIADRRSQLQSCPKEKEALRKEAPPSDGLFI